jgi:hypothetical protein
MLLKLLSASEAQKRTRKFYDDEEVQNKISMILSDINAEIVQSCDEGNNNVVVHVQCNTAAIISMVVAKDTIHQIRNMRDHIDKNILNIDKLSEGVVHDRILIDDTQRRVISLKNQVNALSSKVDSLS